MSFLKDSKIRFCVVVKCVSQAGGESLLPSVEGGPLFESASASFSMVARECRRREKAPAMNPVSSLYEFGAVDRLGPEWVLRLVRSGPPVKL